MFWINIGYRVKNVKPHEKEFTLWNNSYGEKIGVQNESLSKFNCDSVNERIYDVEIIIQIVGVTTWQYLSLLKLLFTDSSPRTFGAEKLKLVYKTDVDNPKKVMDLRRYRVSYPVNITYFGV